MQGREKFSEFAARHTKQLLSWEQSERLADILEGGNTLSLCIWAPSLLQQLIYA